MEVEKRTFSYFFNQFTMPGKPYQLWDRVVLYAEIYQPKGTGYRWLAADEGHWRFTRENI